MSDDARDVERVRRIGLNEALFREVNERLRSLADDFRGADQRLDLICECGKADCDDRVRLTRAEYESLRDDPRLFAIVPGHQLDEVEDVVVRHAGYDVVRKHPGEPGRVADATDPRA
jgi:hypothetical protein